MASLVDQLPPRGASFAFDNATKALEEQLGRIESLDAKAGVPVSRRRGTRWVAVRKGRFPGNVVVALTINRGKLERKPASSAW